MTSLFKKLNLGNRTEILILNTPESFEPELAALKGVTVKQNLDEVVEVSFSLAFVIRQLEVNTIARDVTAKARGDAIIWFAYPKGSSKKYKSEINRDRGWEELSSAGFEAVRQVAIDEDWSALRFRRVDFIKSMRRDKELAITRQGGERGLKGR